jgi:predicted Zn-ribbon and HTH transcriptional regulator
MCNIDMRQHIRLDSASGPCYPALVSKIDINDIPITAILDKRSRMRQIRAEIALLQREWRALTGGEDIRGLIEKVSCNRCGYEWFPNDPFKSPARCPQCQSTSWMRPPTGRSRKPGDPPRPYWKGRRQSRKNPPVAKLRVRPTQQDIDNVIPSVTPSLGKFEKLLSTLDPPP